MFIHNIYVILLSRKIGSYASTASISSRVAPRSFVRRRAWWLNCTVMGGFQSDPMRDCATCKAIQRKGHDTCAKHRLILWLQEIDSEEDLLDHEGRVGVQVLTYHSAKGLEWPVCICCETTKPIKDSAWGLSVSKAKEFSIQEPLDTVLALALRQPEEGR